MAEYRPGDIYTGNFGVVADDVIPASPVGAAQQWADDSDATYCDIYAENSGETTGVSTTLASGDFEPVGGDITALVVRCRIELLVTDVLGQQKFGILFPTSEGNQSPDRQDVSHGSNITDGLSVGVPDWVQFDLLADSIATRIADGVTIMFGTRFAPAGSTGPVAMFRVYEVELQVDGDVPAPFRPTRLYPRDDGLGMSSAPRIHPRPKANRIIGGYR